MSRSSITFNTIQYIVCSILRVTLRYSNLMFALRLCVITLWHNIGNVCRVRYVMYV